MALAVRRTAQCQHTCSNHVVHFVGPHTFRALVDTNLSYWCVGVCVVTMVESRASAEAYLRDKNIGQIFAELGTSLLYHKPADPRQHLIQELEKMKRKAPVR
mgnify:CR=1 FL=1